MMKIARRDRGVTTVEWVIVAMIIGVGGIAVFRTFKDSYMQPTAVRMGDCIAAAAGDGNLCGGLGSGAASSGAGGNAAGGNAAGGNAVAGNGAAANGAAGAGGNGATGNGVGGNGAAGNGAGGPGGMTAGELVNSVGGGGNGGGNRETVNRIGYGLGLEQAAEDALIDAARKGAAASGADTLFKIARTGEGAILSVPLDVIANGVPHNANDAASLAAKTAILGAAAWFGGPVGAVAAIGLDKSLGYLTDLLTGGSRYASDYEDSIAWRMVHGQAGTIGKEGMAQAEANRQQMIHDELEYQRQQQARDAQALREMMSH